MSSQESVNRRTAAAVAPPAPDRPGLAGTYGLSDLARVPLAPERAALLAELGGDGRGLGQGSPVWRARKLAEFSEILALEAIAPRLALVAYDVQTELRLLVRLRVTTPCLRAGELVVEPEAYLAMCYPEELLRGPLPGFALVQVHAPRGVWHSNVSADPAQRLCLGANVPRGLPLREAILGSYAALTLQAVSLDRQDPAGVMNPSALEFWNEHRDRIPLSREAFLDEPVAGATGSGVDPRGEDS